MFRHIVLWKLKENAQGKNKKENSILMKSKLEGLKKRISQIKYISVGIPVNESKWDICLIVDFEDKKALEEYLTHKEHQKVSDFISKIREKRVAFDYEN